MSPLLRALPFKETGLSTLRAEPTLLGDEVMVRVCLKGLGFFSKGVEYNVEKYTVEHFVFNSDFDLITLHVKHVRLNVRRARGPPLDPHHVSPRGSLAR